MNHTVRGQTTPHLSKISCNTACFKQRNDTEGATVTTSGCESFRSHSDTLPGFEHWMLKARAILTLQGAGQQVVCMCLTQEVQQQGLYMIIKRSSMVKKKCPETTPLCSKPRGSLQNNSCVGKVLCAETWPVPNLVLFANKSLREERDTCFWEVRLEAGSTRPTFALAGRGGVP